MAPEKELKNSLDLEDFRLKSSSVSDQKPVAYLFFSLDVVDSTRLKTEEKNWIRLITYFFEAATDYASDGGFFVWKHRGDEILFFKPLHKNINIIDEIASGEDVARRLNDDFRAEHHSIKHDRVLHDPISIKATMWCDLIENSPKGSIDEAEGALQNIADKNRSVKLYLTQRNDTSDHAAVEFLGRGIDAGFRAAQYAHPLCVTLTIELAYLALRGGLDAQKLRVVGFKHLKGVSDQPMPIIWYSDDWSVLSDAFDVKSDSRKSSEESSAIRMPHPLTAELCQKHIFSFGLKDKVADIEVEIEDANEFDQEALAEGPAANQKLAEVHCVAVCFNTAGEVLIGKRPKKKNSPLSEKWEFGCAQLRDHYSFEQAIQFDYLHDYGVKVEEVYPNPVTTFVVEGSDLNGVIFIARVNGRPKPHSNKHQSCFWSRPDFIQFSASDCVPNFYQTLCRAVDMYRSWVVSDE
ncbi:hypothetical protein ACS8YF_15560 [Salinisphaera sp. SWV1]|uniref:hypothetical protein n=1 Tax=Salinisphaera sp. SWV1 TaxID=3454139 RepID=UPI003F87A708